MKIINMDEWEIFNIPVKSNWYGKGVILLYFTPYVFRLFGGKY
jgi:hypothetical protein